MLRVNDVGNVEFVQDWPITRISSLYVPPRRWYIDGDMSRIQKALLYGPKRKPKILRAMSIAKAFCRGQL